MPVIIFRIGRGGRGDGAPCSRRRRRGAEWRAAAGVAYCLGSAGALSLRNNDLSGIGDIGKLGLHAIGDDPVHRDVLVFFRHRLLLHWLLSQPRPPSRQSTADRALWASSNWATIAAEVQRACRAAWPVTRGERSGCECAPPSSPSARSAT